MRLEQIDLINIENFTRFIKEHEQKDSGLATLEDVKNFISIFMEPIPSKYNYSCTSYGLKHVAERVIGHLFYGSSEYFYVSNDMFKKAADEVWLVSKPADDDDTNRYYKFKWYAPLYPFIEAFNKY